MPISAVTGEGVKDLLYHCKNLLNELPDDKVVFEKEYMIKEPDFSNEPYTVEKDENGLFVVEVPRIERMLGFWMNWKTPVFRRVIRFVCMDLNLIIINNR